MPPPDELTLFSSLLFQPGRNMVIKCTSWENVESGKAQSFFCPKGCFDATLLGKISSVQTGISCLRRRNQEVEFLLNTPYSLVPGSLHTQVCLNVPILPSSLHFFPSVPSSYTSSLPSSTGSLLPHEILNFKILPKACPPPSVSCLFQTEKLIRFLSEFNLLGKESASAGPAWAQGKGDSNKERAEKITEETWVRTENCLTRTLWLKGKPNVSHGWNSIQKCGVDDVQRVLAK